MRRSLLLLVVLAACGGTAPTTTTTGVDSLSGVETFADQGQDHLDELELQAILGGAAGPEYNSSPATSGTHAPQSAPCGVYLQEVPDIYLVHTVEHGAVIIHYDPTIVTDPTPLQSFARDRGEYVVVHPRSGLSSPVVLTAWTHLLALDGVDLDTVGTFADAYVGKAPEVGVPCPFDVDETAG